MIIPSSSNSSDRLTSLTTYKTKKRLISKSKSSHFNFTVTLGVCLQKYVHTIQTGNEK